MAHPRPPKTALVAVAKDEGPYIWEWVAHHKAVGFDNIIMFQNDSTDGTDEILSLLQDHGEIQYLYNNAEPGKHQIKAYKRSARQPGFLKSDWVMALDLDEFFTVKHGSGQLRDVWPQFAQQDCVLINWRNFGSCGASALSDRLTTERFTLAEHDRWIENAPNPYKALYRREMFGRPGVHKPPSLDLTDETVRLVNGSALTRDDFKILNFQCSDPNKRHFAQINHYIVKDAQSFVLKNMRGSAHQTARDLGMRYWKRRNKNHVVDTSISLISTKLQKEMLRLDRLTNGKLSDLTREARIQHSSAFVRAMHTDEGMELYRFCIDTPCLDKTVAPLRLI